MKIFDIDGNELQESDLNLERGHLNRTTRIKADAKPIDNVKKFAWDDDDYEEILEYVELPEELYLTRQIHSFKRQLMDTDYCILKVIEGVSSLSDYAEIIAQRKGWRSKINELEARLAKLKGGAS